MYKTELDVGVNMHVCGAGSVLFVSVWVCMCMYIFVCG